MNYVYVYRDYSACCKEFQQGVAYLEKDMLAEAVSSWLTNPS